MSKLLTVGITTLAVTGIVGVGSLSASALNGRNNGTEARTGFRQGNDQGGGHQTSLEARAKAIV